MRYETPNSRQVRRSRGVRLNLGNLADLCLGYLTDNPEELGRFMVATGHSPESLRKALGSPELSHALLDYVAASEPLLLVICATHGIKPEQFMAVWAKLNPAG